MPCSLARFGGFELPADAEGERRKREGERRRAPCVSRGTHRGGDRKETRDLCFSYEGCGLGEAYTYRGCTNRGKKENQRRKV